MQRGKIILLNGVACSGKTTLMKKLQERLTDPFYGVSFDTFLNMTPGRYFGDRNGREIVNKAASMHPYTIRSFSDAGLNTIVDCVLLKTDTLLEKYIELLHEYPLLFVRVTCPPDELHRRSKERGGNSKI